MVHIYTSAEPPVPIPSVDISTYLFSPDFARPTDSPSNRLLVTSTSSPSASLTTQSVQSLARQLGAGLTQIWSSGITPLIPSSPLPLAPGSAPSRFSAEEEKTTCLLFSPNTTTFALALLAGLLSPKGIILTLANSSYTASELRHQIVDSRAGLILVHPELLGVVEECLGSEGGGAGGGWRERVVIMGDELEGGKRVSGYRAFEELRVKEEGEVKRLLRGKRPDPEDVAFLCYSSGTTGLSKGVATTHRNIVNVIMKSIPAWPTLIPMKDAVLQPLPAYHIFGLLNLLICYKLQVLSVVLKRFDPDAFCKAIQTHKVAFTTIVPPILVVLANPAISSKYDISTLKTVISGAAPLGVELTHRVLSTLPHLKIMQGYGLTETSPTCTITPHSAGPSAYGSIGALLSNVEARLVDEEEKDVPVGERGELWIRGGNVMKGYWRNPEATKGCMAEGGWFKTGDVAMIDKDGLFFIVDRLKELIKYKGFQVPPAELEAKLLSLESIADVGVIGVWDDERATEVPRAYVVPAAGSDTSKGDKLCREIEVWLAGQVSDHKKLRGGVHLIEAIPKSAAGKILRRQLRDLAAKDAKSGKTKIRSKL